MIDIKNRLNEHFTEALQYFPMDNIVTLCLQGSQNYHLETDNSDVDTKLIITPTFQQIAFNKQPVSTTHVRTNNEHIDFKDVRLYIDTFRKQNLNFLEILFTKYQLINPDYAQEWGKLITMREDVAHYNPWRAVKSMKGVGLEKYHALEHRYPAKVDIIDKWGYDGKQLHHLVRIDEFLKKYIAGVSYEECLIPNDPEYLIALKNQGYYPLEKAREVAEKTVQSITEIADNFCATHQDKANKNTELLFQEVQYNIMRKSVEKELKKNDC